MPRDLLLLSVLSACLAVSLLACGESACRDGTRWESGRCVALQAQMAGADGSTAAGAAATGSEPGAGAGTGTGGAGMDVDPVDAGGAMLVDAGDLDAGARGDALMDAGVDDNDPGSAAAGNDGDGEDAAAQRCELLASPRDAPCLISDDHAVFVSNDGSSGAPATMAEPEETIQRAILRASERGLSHVIVCGGVYSLSLIVTTRIQIHGGFDCSDGSWSYAGASTSLQPAGNVAPLIVSEVTGPVLVEDIDFIAPSTDEAGRSSIAAIVHGSFDVALRRVALLAGEAGDGADGVTETYSFPRLDLKAKPPAKTVGGFTADGNAGGAERNYTCPNGETTRGGAGGDFIFDPAYAYNGRFGLPDLGGGVGGTGGQPCSPGQRGRDGTDGESGGGASTLGTLDGENWLPSPGVAGESGHVGQGGGGGGALYAVGGGGGGGGGGCGGPGGAAGGGGGGSIALLSNGSNVNLHDCTLQTAQAGDGGSGSEGGAGMPLGGKSGAGTGGGCDGGEGGGGGDGGNAGGGAGGISIGILYAGTAPTLTNVSVSPGQAGSGGAGPDDTSTDDDGVDGVAQEMLEL